MAKQLFPFRNRKWKNGNVYNIFPIAEFTKRQKQGPNANLSVFHPRRITSIYATKPVELYSSIGHVKLTKTFEQK